MTQSANEQAFAQLMDVLSNEENVTSLLYLLNKLPDIAKAVQTIDEAVAFTQNVWHDKESIDAMFQDMASKWEATGLNKETLDALRRILQILPTVVPLLEKVANTSAFVAEAVQDKESMASLSDEMAPVTAFVDESWEVLKETKQRVQADEQLPNVSIWKLLQLLKDPNVRKGYQYAHTLLNVLSEREQAET